MHRLFQQTYQKGEVALTLSLIGILITVIGIGLGVSTAGNLQTRNSEAQSGPFPYTSILELRDEAGNLVEWEPGMRWSNNYATNNNGDIKDPNQTKAKLSWITGDVQPTTIRNSQAQVTIALPSGYTVVAPFCTSVPSTICSNSTLSNGSLTRSNILISSGGSITYGLKVKKITPPPPPSGKGNIEVQVVALNYPQKTRFWESNHVASRKPASCSRQGSGEDQRPLYLSSFKLIATCSGGGCTPGTRSEVNVGKNKGYGSFLDLPTGQYQIGIKDTADRGFDVWDGCKDKVYTVAAGQTNQLPVIMLQNRIDGEYETVSSESTCKADGGQPNLIQGIRGNLCYGASTPQTTGTPGGGGGSDLQCSRACIYSQLVGGTQKCFEGRCPADRPDCGGNTPKERIDNGNKGCAYAGNACGVPAREVSCSSGEPVVTPKPSSPPPVSPTSPPSGLACNRPCVYSDQGKCWEGRCQTGNQNCKDGIENANNGCSYSGTACGVHRELDCATGKPKVAPATLKLQVNFSGVVSGANVEYQAVIDTFNDGKRVFTSPEVVVQRGPTRATRSNTYSLSDIVPGTIYKVGILDNSSDSIKLISSHVNCNDSRAPEEICKVILQPGQVHTVTLNVTIAGVSPVPSRVPPTQAPEPSPTPTGDLTVKVNNRYHKVKSVAVRLDPCPRSGDCVKTIAFNGSVDVQEPIVFSQIRSGRYVVKISNIEPQAGFVEKLRGVVHAQENGRVIVDDCPGARGGPADDQDCTLGSVPNIVEFSIHSNEAPPPPPPTPGPPPPGPDPVTGPYTIPLRDTNVGLVSNFKDVIRSVWPHAMPYDDKLRDAAISKNWNPGLLLAAWMEETGASTTTMESAGGAGIGIKRSDGRTVYSTEHLGCRPGTIQQIDENMACFFGPPRTDLQNDEFIKFAAGYCGPNQPILCGNNPNFLKNLGKMYDKIVPPGSPGSRRPLSANFSPTDVVEVSTSQKIGINNIAVNDFMSNALENQSYVTILNTDLYLFGYALGDNAFYVDVKQGLFTDTLREAQTAIMSTLGVTKNELCYLGIYGTGSPESIPEDKGMFSSLPLCEGAAQADMNGDNFVNSFDFSICIDEAQQAELAPDQEADYLCDMNVNRRIDAVDISKSIQYFGMSVATDGVSGIEVQPAQE